MTYNDFKKEKIHIFTLVTGPYVNFFDNFIKSIGNFFPENKKVIHIASDGLEGFDGVSFDEYGVDYVDVKHIIDLPFPLIPLQKTYMQKNYITSDMGYVFYFDIDTIFIQREPAFWEWLASECEKNIVMSVHPHYDSNMIGSVHNIIENNKDSEAYIPSEEEPNTRVISSFWGGTSENVLRMCDYVNMMFKKDLGTIRYLPRFIDENYINKLIWLITKESVKDLTFKCDEHLVETTYHYFNKETPNVFLFQKYDINIKESKKRVD